MILREAIRRELSSKIYPNSLPKALQTFWATQTCELQRILYFTIRNACRSLAEVVQHGCKILRNAIYKPQSHFCCFCIDFGLFKTVPWAPRAASWESHRPLLGTSGRPSERSWDLLATLGDLFGSQKILKSAKNLMKTQKNVVFWAFGHLLAVLQTI